MSGARTPWPGAPYDTEPRLATLDPPLDVPTVTAHDDERLTRQLEAAVTASDAPDVVFAASRHGRRILRSGGTAPTPPQLREDLRYEIGSATKTYTGLLLTHLVDSGRLTGGEPAVTLLDPGRDAGTAPVTLAHLMTHTSGLPALPRDFYVRALPAWHTNPYARYPAARVVDAFLRHHPRHRPGVRWHYSNFGVAVLGHALAPATGASWQDLLTEHVLRPLRLHATALRPDGPQLDAVGHTKDGSSTVPAFDAGGFPAAGAVRATPHDLLTFLEAHLDPGDAPPAGALRAVRTPVLRRGLGHRHVHTVAWFRHPTAEGGPMYFHSGATLGQQAFLGFRPDTATAVAALCTRRFRAGDPFVSAAYALLAED
ncbi:beta-lactamase family protein [Streptomyces spinoverrucosus]|uniref:serine hydrolase domain-containing protein n=1 Tax=Streptomyces spinoverrucosus TaxID=284043 RepID=UPI0018C43DEA|nr:serine hydrolase domain-containing protein [Streptomyces spinoverrucosus]MBG0857635.1 beta-lactamase family protein [Streptomyces spinoverrucosus]